MKTSIFIITGALLFAPNALAKDVQYDLRVDGMTCPFCAATSEKALKKIKGVTAVSTDLKKAVIRVCADEQADLSDARLTKLLKKKGFTYVEKSKSESCALNPKTQKTKTGFLRSLFHKHT